MGNIDELISNIDSRRRNPKNTELWEFIKGSLEQIKEINESYKKYYQGTEEAPAMFKIIEEKYQKIKDELEKRELKDIPTDKLFELFIKLYSLLKLDYLFT